MFDFIFEYVNLRSHVLIDKLFFLEFLRNFLQFSLRLLKSLFIRFKVRMHCVLTLLEFLQSHLSFSIALESSILF